MSGLSEADFEKLMAAHQPPEGFSRLAVACSGGPDSMALAGLMKNWTQKTKRAFVALIVDHGLRAESAREASLVQKRLAASGIDAEILKPAKKQFIESDIQNQARILRYALLRQYCENHAIDCLMTAHHREDQAETFLLRLARGSGVDGLSAMQQMSRLGKIYLLRPLLEVEKEKLHATLTRLRLEPVQDPSNLDPSFDRVRLRQAKQMLAALGLDTDRLVETARIMARARRALEEMTVQFLRTGVEIYPEGFCRLSRAGLAELPDEILLRVLSQLLRRVSGKFYPPRLVKLERLAVKIRAGDLSGGGTLSGCVARFKGSYLYLFREISAISDCLARPGEVIWDGRFRLRFSSIVEPMAIRPLGPKGWQDVQTLGVSSDLPAMVRNGLPAFWQGDKLLCVPHLQNQTEFEKWGLVDIRFKGLENFASGPFHQATAPLSID